MKKRANLALLSCEDLSDFVADDEWLVTALRERHGIQGELVPWTMKMDWSRFKTAIIRTTWDYTSDLPRFLKTLGEIEAAGCPVLNPPRIVTRNADKRYLRDLRQRGVPIVPTVFGEAGVSAEEIAHQLPAGSNDRAVLKPFVGANASKIEVMKLREAPNRAVAVLELEPRGWLLQPFLEEIRGGEISLHFFDGEFSHAIRKVPAADDFRVQEEHGGTILSYQPTARAISKRLDLTAESS